MAAHPVTCNLLFLLLHMRKTTPMTPAKWTLACTILTLLLAACGETVVPPPRTADYYLSEGDTLIADERYDDAIATLQKIRDNYFSPEVNARADLKIADTHYLAEQYAEAATAYEAFLKQYPDHESSAHVLYQLGNAYFKQMLTPDRDQTATSNALSAFATFVARFPGDPRKDEAVDLMARCRQQLAAHELGVGAFYVRTKYYAAAIARLTSLPNDYPDFTRQDEVYYQLGRAWLGLEDRPKAADAFNRLYKEFPESKYVLKAQKLLERDF